MTSKGSDQTARMRRLVWAFAGRTYHIVGNLMSRLILLPLTKGRSTYATTTIRTCEINQERYNHLTLYVNDVHMYSWNCWSQWRFIEIMPIELYADPENSIRGDLTCFLLVINIFHIRLYRSPLRSKIASRGILNSIYKETYSHMIFQGALDTLSPLLWISTWEKV